MKISIIIPTLNEAHHITRLLRRLQAEGSPEIIVVDGGSTDDTIARARAEGALTLHCDPPSRARQLNIGARRASHPLLYFVHADTLPPQGYQADIAQAVAEGYPMGCYRFRFESNRWLLKVNSFFTRFDRLWCRGGDQSLFIKKELFEEIGGFQEAFSIMEEYDLIERAREQNDFKIIPRDILVSARKYEENGYLRVQWANFIAFRMYRQDKKPDLIRKRYAELLHFRG